MTKYGGENNETIDRRSAFGMDVGTIMAAEAYGHIKMLARHAKERCSVECRPYQSRFRTRHAAVR